MEKKSLIFFFGIFVQSQPINKMSNLFKFTSNLLYLCYKILNYNIEVIITTILSKCII